MDNWKTDRVLKKEERAIRLKKVKEERKTILTELNNNYDEIFKNDFFGSNGKDTEYILHNGA